MKKKTIVSLLVGAAMLAVTPACTNLDETVYDQLPADSFGATTTQVNALVGSVYKTLRTYFPGSCFYLAENSGSGTVTPTRKGGDWYDGGQFRELFMHTWTANTSAVKNAWGDCSTAIGTCNSTISVLQNATVLSDSEKAQKLAEVRGVRAFWYYVMVDFWGNVPLVTDYADKTLPTCQTRQTVYDWLITEVTAIADQCPDASSANYGKFTKGSAYTLLAKLYLNAEAWGVTVNGNAYQKVIEACDKVMGMDYSLDTNWKDNFIASNQNSKEAILAECFSSSDTNNNNYFMNMTLHYKDKFSLGLSVSTWNGVCAQPDYVKLFDQSDPRFVGTYLTGQQYYKGTTTEIITDHGRPLNHTIDVTMIPGTEYDGTAWGSVNQEDGARCWKWTFADDLTNAMENDFHIFRLADVYLMKAEALLRSGGSVAEATSLVNKIRERAYGNATHDYATVDLAKVQLERRLELAWECWSRQDDIRFGCFDKPMWSASSGLSSGVVRSSGDYLKLFPVSQLAWQSNPNLTQNPGYAAFQ
jgi:hypothetical protein